MKNNIFGVKSFCFICVVSVSVFLVNPHISVAYEKEINTLSAAMAEKIANAGKTRVAVVDFTDLQGNVTEFGRFIAEEFSVAIASAGKGFTVIDRTHLQSILREHVLSQTGLIDPQTARELGKITGVEALITGTITPFGESVRVAIKILDTTTAEVIDAQRGNIPKTQAIEELLGRGIESGALTTPETATTPPKAKAQPTKTQQSVEAQGFTFALLECKRSGENVTCSVLITSNDQDRELRIYGYFERDKTRIIDEFGNEYKPKQIQLGNVYIDSGTSLENVLVAGIPVKAILSFEEVESQAGMIALLEFDCSSENHASKDKFSAQLRNIPLSK